MERSFRASFGFQWLQCLFALNERRNCREASRLHTYNTRLRAAPFLLPLPNPFSLFTLVDSLLSFVNNRDNGAGLPELREGRHQRRSRSLIATPRTFDR